MQYECQQGDVLDDICFKQFGTEALVPQVLNLNHALVNYGTHLPQGLIIELPDIKPPEEPTVQQIKLYE